MSKLIGTSIYDLDTPSLLLDLEKLKVNIEEMADFAKVQSVQLRPHIKTHKSIEIAKMQVEAGACGVTVAKVSEAEVMASGGISDILIAYPIANPKKIERIIQLIKQGTHIKLAVDSLEQIKLLQKALESTTYTLEVWIKVNSGLNRCGVEPGQSVVDLAQAIILLSNLHIGGVFTHAGHSYAAKTQAEIEKIGYEEAAAVVEGAEACEKAGISIPVRSIGSTPTYKIAGKVTGITEVRPGNAAFFDAIQVGLQVTTIERCALTVLASTINVYGQKRIIFDTGSKCLNLDKGAHGNDTVKGFGHVLNHPEITIERLSEEHGIGSIDTKTTLSINDKVQVVPNHACTVANLFDHYIVHQWGKVVNVWNVDARGKVQ